MYNKLMNLQEQTEAKTRVGSHVRFAIASEISSHHRVQRSECAVDPN